MDFRAGERDTCGLVTTEAALCECFKGRRGRVWPEELCFMDDSEERLARVSRLDGPEKLDIQSGISGGLRAVVGRGAMGLIELCEYSFKRDIGRFGDWGGGLWRWVLGSSCTGVVALCEPSSSLIELESELSMLTLTSSSSSTFISEVSVDAPLVVGYAPGGSVLWDGLSARTSRHPLHFLHARRSDRGPDIEAPILALLDWRVLENCMLGVKSS